MHLHNDGVPRIGYRKGTLGTSGTDASGSPGMAGGMGHGNSTEGFLMRRFIMRRKCASFDGAPDAATLYA